MNAAALSFVDARLAFLQRGREIKALDGIAVDIAKASLSCIVGPNGAGKTTLLRVAAGLAALDSGSCALLGRALTVWPREERARRIAYLPQGGETAWPLRAHEIVALGRLPHGAGNGRGTARDRDAVERALIRADVAHLADRRVDRLSAGERVRVLFARALSTEADILLADEPAAHLDPEHQLRLMELLTEEAARGAAVVVTLHELALAARCARVLVLDQGRVAADGPPEVALNDDTLARIFRVEVVRADAPDTPVTTIPVSWRRLPR